MSIKVCTMGACQKVLVLTKAHAKEYDACSKNGIRNTHLAADATMILDLLIAARVNAKYAASGGIAACINNSKIYKKLHDKMKKEHKQDSSSTRRKTKKQRKTRMNQRRVSKQASYRG